MNPSAELLGAVFGIESSGETPVERARSSRRKFVRSQHQISMYREGATGRILDAKEALSLVGWEKLQELADRPAAPLVGSSDEPYRTVERRLNGLGVTLAEAAKKSRWTSATVKLFEHRKQVPYKELMKIAQGLNLDEDRLGLGSYKPTDDDLSARLRTLKDRNPAQFTVSTVLGMAQAAWTIRKQYELAELLGQNDRSVKARLGFRPSSDYGHREAPFKVGYRLAHEARALLQLSPGEPINCLKDLVETRLRIPVIQHELSKDFAGATIEAGAERGIVVNLNGANSSPFVRRMTIAHELGHLLWDPNDKLLRLVVDPYERIDKNYIDSSSGLDDVEARANAFAIEFLAPGAAIVKAFNEAASPQEGLSFVVNTFGISKSAAARHLYNASQHGIDVRDLNLRLAALDVEAWEGRESLAVPLFAPEDVPVTRRGRFASYVLRALREQLISEDTAASLYGCVLSELPNAIRSTENYVA